MGKHLPAVTLLLPGGLFIVGAWLAVEFLRHHDDFAEGHTKGLAGIFERKREGG